MFGISPVIITMICAFVLIIIAAVVSFRFGISYRKKIAEAEIGSAEQEAKKIIAEAAVAAENEKREKLIEAKEATQKLRTEMEKEIKEQRADVQRQERRIQQKR